VSSAPEQIIAEVFAGLASTVSKAVGERERHTHAAPPRVVAIPIGAPVIDNGRQGMSPPGTAPSKSKQRHILLRRFQIDWECHGAPSGAADVNDFAIAEALALDVMTLLRSACHPWVRFSGERWIDQQPNADGYERHGSVIAFTSVIDLPVYPAERALSFLVSQPPFDTDFSLGETTLPPQDEDG
jgi:hypothetical protein